MLQTILALLGFLLPLAYSPGPGNMFFAANGARFGLRATLPANIGYHLVTWGVTAAIGFGFLTAFTRYPQVFSGLKIAGALYVLYLAWTLWRASALTDAQAAKPAGFWDGVILLVLNPKAYVIIALMFTQFLNQTGLPQRVEVVFIATVFTLNNLLAFLLWTLLGDQIARRFRHPNTAALLNRLFGGLLAAVALWMLF